MPNKTENAIQNGEKIEKQSLRHILLVIFDFYRRNRFLCVHFAQILFFIYLFIIWTRMDNKLFDSTKYMYKYSVASEPIDKP